MACRDEGLSLLIEVRWQSQAEDIMCGCARQIIRQEVWLNKPSDEAYPPYRNG